MRASIIPAARAREAENELYDRGCDLVEAAAAIQQAATSDQAVRAIPAVLGCIESALQALLWAAAAFEVTTLDDIDRRSDGQSDSRTDRRRERMHVGYANLQRSLSDAERASAAARGLARRALDSHRTDAPS